MKTVCFFLRTGFLATSILAVCLISLASADNETEDVMGGVIVIRNCPASEIKHLKFMPSNAASSGWAELINGDQQVRIRFNDFTNHDLETFNRLGEKLDPKIKVMFYHGDFIFFVKSEKNNFQTDFKSQGI